MQDDVRLDAAVKDGSFKKNPIFLQAIEHAKKNGTALHLLAYLTYKSSHGCIDYPLAICEMARDAGLDQVFFHIILTAAPRSLAPRPSCWQSWTKSWMLSAWAALWMVWAAAWRWTGTRTMTR